MENDIKEIQEKILEIAIYFDHLCQAMGITYYLMGGSALGAMRHKGFIPWDDDLDVFMTFDNYTKILDATEQHLDKERFYLQREHTAEWPMYFSKLRMNGTTFIEEDTKNRDMHKGLYIDIMCLNNVSDNKVYHLFQYLAARLLTISTLAERGYITDSRIKKIAIFSSQFLIGETIRKLLIRFVRSKNKEKTALVGHFFGRARFSKTSFPSQYLGTPRYLPFSNVLLPVPQEVEKYLKIRYGNSFMEHPDERTKSQYPQHSAFVDLSTDYREYE